MTETTTAPAPILTNRLYDKLKIVALIVLPALALVALVVFEIMGFDKMVNVVGGLIAGDTALGALLRYSAKQYYRSDARYDGDVVVTPEDGGNRVTIAFNRSPEDVVDEPGKHSMEFKVKRMGF